jgi:hypothetical protein
MPEARANHRVRRWGRCRWVTWARAPTGWRAARRSRRHPAFCAPARRLRLTSTRVFRDEAGPRRAARRGRASPASRRRASGFAGLAAGVSRSRDSSRSSRGVWVRVRSGPRSRARVAPGTRLARPRVAVVDPGPGRDARVPAGARLLLLSTGERLRRPRCGPARPLALFDGGARGRAKTTPRPNFCTWRIFISRSNVFWFPLTSIPAMLFCLVLKPNLR